MKARSKEMKRFFYPLIIFLLTMHGAEVFANECLYCLRSVSAPYYRIWSGDKEIPLPNIANSVIEKVFYDQYNYNIWCLYFFKLENRYCLYNVSSKKYIYLKQKNIEGISVYKNTFLFRFYTDSSQYKYCLYDLDSLNEEIISDKITGVNEFTISGFDEDKLFFDQGYYSIQTKETYLYPNSNYWCCNLVCPKENIVILTNRKSRKIYLYDYIGKNLFETNIKSTSNYSSKQMYYTANGILYYSKHSVSFANLVSGFFPGGHKHLVWNSFDLNSKKKTKIKMNCKGDVYILGMLP